MSEFAWQRVAGVAHRLSWLKVGKVIAGVPAARNATPSEISAIRVRACLPAVAAKLLKGLFRRGHSVVGVPVDDLDAAGRLIGKIVSTERFLIGIGASRIEWKDGRDERAG